jgi:hypothetical protein
MKAFRIDTHGAVAPFGGPVGSLAVGGTTLAAVQETALAEAGITLVASPPEGEPYLLFSDRTWFTSTILKRMKSAGLGRLQIANDDWLAWTGSLQDWPEPGLYELAVVHGAPSFDDVPPLLIDVDFNEVDLAEVHASMKHAKPRPYVVSSAMAHQIDHWSHIVRVNKLVLANRLEEARDDWESAGMIGRIWRIFKVLWKAKSLKSWRIAQALNEVGEDVTIHPSAVVEFSVLGAGVTVGPHALVRGSILGPGTTVDSQAIVNASVLSEGSKVGRQAHINLCTLFRGAMVSAGDGHQASVFGESAFVAWGATLMDLSFGSTIKVERHGPGSERVDTGTHFLGAAIGHRARIGHGVKLGYGVAVPNDAFLVADGPLLKTWGDGPVDGPAIIEDGQAKPKR